MHGAGGSGAGGSGAEGRYVRGWRGLAGLLVVAGLGAAACSSSSKSSVTATPAPAGAPAPAATTPPAPSPAPAPASATTAQPSSGAATLGTATTKLGAVLVDGSGFTLYRFDKDTATTSACTGGCSGTWPPVLAGGAKPAGSAAVVKDLATLTRADGGIQVTYQGHPVYRYSPDKAPGDTNGDGIGGVWHAVVIGTAKAATPAPSGY